jgi:carboxypeptidase C (cathepsin A)
MRSLSAGIFLFILTTLVLADDKPTPIKEMVSKTSHSITLDGKKIEYEATAATIPLRDEEGKALANIFYIAYTKKDEDPTKRPVTFCFNGGPGSSSVWLHMGAFGPRRVAMTDAGDSLPPPARLVDNDDSLLDITDLVFIDPVSTGYSRAANEKDAKNYHGVTEDLQSVGEFIRLYVTKNNRWSSPKYLAGESYGTTRAAGLSGVLSRMGMRLNGIALISAVLNFQTISFDDNNNDQPYVFFLPTYTATAWFHKKLDPTMQADMKKTLADAVQFANGEYATALQKGLLLTDQERKDIAAKVAKYTGLSAEYVLRSDLRINAGRYMRELLRDRGQTTGRYDSRYLGKDLVDVGDRPEYDPSYSAVQGPFTEAFNTYVRTTLKFETDVQYEILTGRVQPWNYGQSAQNRFLTVAPTLRTTMVQNPDLRVFVANGYYDLATPFAGTEYTFQHLGSDRKLLDRVTMGYYEAGHMMYLHKPSRDKLKKDLAGFIK